MVSALDFRSDQGHGSRPKPCFRLNFVDKSHVFEKSTGNILLRVTLRRDLNPTQGRIATPLRFPPTRLEAKVSAVSEPTLHPYLIYIFCHTTR